MSIANATIHMNISRVPLQKAQFVFIIVSNIFGPLK